MTCLRLFAAAVLLASLLPAANAAPTPQHFMFVAYGDTRTTNDIHARVIGYVVSLHPEFVLQTGDLVGKADDLAEWQVFDKIEKPLRDAGIPYYPGVGNHDAAGIYTHPNNHFFQYVPAGVAPAHSTYYSFVRHGIRFIQVDTEVAPYGPGSPQYNWIIAQLSLAARWHQAAIPMYHKATWSIGLHGSGAVDTQHTADQLALHQLWVKYHPALVITGRDHLYYRTVRDGVTYIVTGGGAPPYLPEHVSEAVPGDVFVHPTLPDGALESPANFHAEDGIGSGSLIADQISGKAPTNPVYLRYAESVFHIVRCDVSGNTLACTARRPDGSQIDRFSVPLLRR